MASSPIAVLREASDADATVCGGHGSGGGEFIVIATKFQSAGVRQGFAATVHLKVFTQYFY